MVRLTDDRKETIMAMALQTRAASERDLHDEQVWADLLSALRPRVRRSVYAAHRAYWYGQEEDIVDDIVQETACRIIERIREIERGKAQPVYTLEGFMAVTARNYCTDLERHDRRLQHLDDSPAIFPAERDQQSPLEIAIERIYQEELFARLAHEVARFPAKRRRALLIDLAKRMHFNAEPTPLQLAFLAEGIDLRAYWQPRPEDSIERSRQASLTSLAYKQVGLRMRAYDAGE
jgi:DNA-directed RNA polymerase specialized sigma24 family protein